MQKKLNKLLGINIDSEKFIGYAYHNFGDLDNALSILQKVVKENPYDAEIHFVIGKIYFKKNMFHEALEALQNTRLLLPEHMPAIKLIEKIELMLK